MLNSTEDYKISLDTQIEKLEQILKENPQDPSTLMALGETALRRGKKLMALQVFQKLSEIKPDAIEVHASLAKIYGTQKMFDEAYSELARALELDKGNIESRAIYNILIHESSPPEQLAPFFKTAINSPLKPENLAVYLQQLEIEKEKLQKDLEEFSSLLELSPMNTILEYSKNMANQRLKIVEDLLKSAQELEKIKFESAPEMQLVKSEAAESETSIVPEKILKETPPQEILSEEPLPSLQALNAQTIRELFEPMAEQLKNSKGVKGLAIFYLNNEIVTIIADSKEEISSTIPVLTENLSSLLSYSESLKSWIIEFQQGLLIIQSLIPKLFFGIYADTPSVLGTLLFAIDKSCPKFIEALKNLNKTQTHG
jgi:tetratricopeptide (TPR) repeat protein